MLPMNNAQLGFFMQMQQMQQMQQIQQILQSTMPLLQQQQQQMQLDDNDDEDDEIARTLFCANLDERVDEEVLYELFLQAGPLDNVRLPKQRTFAFITYTHACSPAYAMHLFQGLSLYGKPLVIKYNGKTAAPPLLRRLLPPDWGIIDKNSQQGRTQQSFDNTALRGAYYNPFANDCNVNKRYPNQNNRDQSPNGRRNDGKDHSRRERMGRERLHSNSGPYERGRRDSSRERDRRSNNHRHNEKRSNYI